MTLHLEALSSSIYRNIQECIRNESIEGSDFPEPLLFASGNVHRPQFLSLSLFYCLKGLKLNS